MPDYPPNGQYPDLGNRVGSGWMPRVKLDVGGDGLSVPVVGALPVSQPGLSGSVVQKVTTLTNAGTAYPVPAVALAGRSALLVQASPTNSAYVYVGGASVTADTAATGGIILAPGQSVPISLGATVVLYAVSTVAGQLVRTMEVA